MSNVFFFTFRPPRTPNSLPPTSWPPLTLTTGPPWTPTSWTLTPWTPTPWTPTMPFLEQPSPGSTPSVSIQLIYNFVYSGSVDSFFSGLKKKIQDIYLNLKSIVYSCDCTLFVLYEHRTCLRTYTLCRYRITEEN